MMRSVFVVVGMLMSMSAQASLMPELIRFELALSGDADAIAALRDGGQDALDALIALRTQKPSMADEETWVKTIDAVAGQKDAATSGLFWYTDLDAAKAEAAATGRPILSLRLLGLLTEEYSCANSRMFRALLYTHPDVQKVLREQFVLHWSSERPAPRLTIDMGDGRQMVRTITGNSAHYLLDAQGRPIDIVPGLYAPAVFLEQLADARALSDALGGLDDRQRAKRLERWHQTRYKQALTALSDVLDAPNEATLTRWLHGEEAQPLDNDLAIEAMALTATKAINETPTLRMFVPRNKSPDDRDDDQNRGDWQPTPEDWSEIGLQAYGDVSAPSPEAVDFIAAQRPLDALGAEMSLDPMLATLRETVAADTAINELQLHAKAHYWFARANGEIGSFDALNARVYDELFSTPASDPWMGLLIEDVYTGLERGGVQ